MVESLELLRNISLKAGHKIEEIDIVEKALDRIFTLHADHEQNASTSSVRLAGSSGANPYACIAAGVASLWGPAHGGANEACLRMLEEIGSVDRIPEYVARAKDKNDPFRLFGFGHRVYKTFDPRAVVTKFLMLCTSIITLFLRLQQNLRRLHYQMSTSSKEIYIQTLISILVLFLMRSVFQHQCSQLFLLLQELLVGLLIGMRCIQSRILELVVLVRFILVRKCVM